MSIELVEMLRSRAETFMEEAESLHKRRRYDVACFNAEQAAQLRLKALALRMVDYMPRTHRVREILGIIVKALHELERNDLAARVESLIAQRGEELRMLEEAYTAARYMLRRYDEGDAEICVGLAHEIVELCEEVERDVFR